MSALVLTSVPCGSSLWCDASEYSKGGSEHDPTEGGRLTCVSEVVFTSVPLSEASSDSRL